MLINFVITIFFNIFAYITIRNEININYMERIILLFIGFIMFSIGIIVPMNKTYVKDIISFSCLFFGETIIVIYFLTSKNFNIFAF